MVRIPPEVRIKASIRPGSVYYFHEETFRSQDPHYFIVVNVNPADDAVIFLVCPSSQTAKVLRRRRSCPVETLVHISPAQYPDFRVESVVDCNYVLEKSINQLVEKLAQGKLKVKTEIDVSLVRRLRRGILSSPLIEGRVKAALGE
ncbi:MAG: hypothetical protein HY673_19970 [Chloroflexi bacterium]|nr:hypothetical protein [Chloroflexota bacterium]